MTPFCHLVPLANSSPLLLAKRTEYTAASLEQPQSARHATTSNDAKRFIFFCPTLQMSRDTARRDGCVSSRRDA